MRIKIGCDIVYLPRFKKSSENAGREFLSKLFTSAELAATADIKSLAGMFAAKEATIKALGMQAGNWQNIEISKDKNGRPQIKILDAPHEIMSQDISISIAHDGDYVMATAVFLTK